MKKFIMVTALALVSQSPILADRVSDKEKLETAVEESNLLLVKKLMKRIGDLDAKAKKDLVALAEDILDERESHILLMKSPWDLSRLVLGSGAVLTGLAYTISQFVGKKPKLRESVERDANDRLRLASSFESEKTPWLKIALATLFGSYGGFEAYKGLVCTAAKARADVAAKVLAEINKPGMTDSEKQALKA